MTLYFFYPSGNALAAADVILLTSRRRTSEYLYILYYILLFIHLYYCECKTRVVFDCVLTDVVVGCGSTVYYLWLGIELQLEAEDSLALHRAV